MQEEADPGSVSAVRAHRVQPEDCKAASQQCRGFLYLHTAALTTKSLYFLSLNITEEQDHK